MVGRERAHNPGFPGIQAFPKGFSHCLPQLGFGGGVEDLWHIVRVYRLGVRSVIVHSQKIPMLTGGCQAAAAPRLRHSWKQATFET